VDPVTLQNFLNFQQIQVSEKKPLQQFRALVANDDSFQLQIIGMLMKKCGFIVDEAENG
jgi:PleD family two-component response regulator